ncbi:maltokinase N-terminal cap-like domain-containing protein [Nocardia suismassiliense]|uniref:maltokinase N-terminal cap-like domain-containing protein n=1 Tax=Nocardia suismassiliense TaxID=2077092 RepID=UPI000D1F2F50|nr:1,4-alpha-glucan branching protein [Nocardia suismassiliense]
MAVIHETTMVPTKVELLASWLPTRSWYRGSARPVLQRTGGFRLDDPAGEVGIEFMVVTDTSVEEPVTYQVPFAYRGAPRDGAEDALIGTSMHGVLGKRWLYDGTRDPVVVAQILALLGGSAQPQAQHASATVDESVAVSTPDIAVPTLESEPVVAEDGSSRTDIMVGAQVPGSTAIVRVNRVLQPGDESSDRAGAGHVTASWQSPDGTSVRGVFLSFEGHVES